MVPIQSVLYEMLPRPNVTIRKCTTQNVNDTFFFSVGPRSGSRIRDPDLDLH